ncbi:NADP-dependent oxidoreductase domain-containing protein [Armillaria luteobubalina]|uniref:NADP-dependent oxidoreductase domain-containing protein n=1 Tax=Armillaria luteobubalina TaxID=153913 RepID=A0AA39UPP7_9AGAR|nr:NADP-dependent oxidoreductase domain-containing protein [Armillaria luteobubalina]
MSLFQVGPDPPTKLGIYCVLSSRPGVRVSPLVLGAMNIGDKWEVFGMRSMKKEASFELLDTYFNMGGNFIDTVKFYQDEILEDFLGEWAEKRGIRDQLIIATKYTSNYKRGDNAVTQKINYVGNSTNSMHINVEASLNKLRTSYIDILYVHWWDYETSIPKSWAACTILSRRGRVNGVSLNAPSSITWLGTLPLGCGRTKKLRTDVEEQQWKETGEKGRTMFSPNWERTEVKVKIPDVYGCSGDCIRDAQNTQCVGIWQSGIVPICLIKEED